MGPIFPLICIFGNFWLDARQWKIYLSRYWIFLYSWRSLFWQLLGNNLMFSDLALNTRQDRTVLSLGLIIPHNWGKTLLCTLSTALWMMLFQYVLWEQPLFPALFELGSITSNTFRWSLSWPQVISSPACPDQYSPENSREILSRFLEFSFCAALSSLVLCAANSSHFGFTRLSALSYQTRDPTRLFLWSPWLCWGLEILSRQ